MITIDVDTVNNILGIEDSFKASIAIEDKIKDPDAWLKMLEEFDKLDSDKSYDWFTDYYQEEHSDRSKNKQDFTPDGVVTLVDKLTGDFNVNVDIAAGTGGLTIKKWNRNPNGYFYCEDFSDRAVPFLLLNLSLRNVNGFVFHGDSLGRTVKHLYKLIKGDKFSTIEEVDTIPEVVAQSVVMNPPYSFKWDPKKELLEDPRFKDYEKLAPKTKADFAFLLTGLYHLDTADGATQALILPHGVLFRGSAEGTIRKHLLENNYLDAVIGLPANLFLNTAIPTVALVLKKNKTTNDVLFIDASKEFEKGKNQNTLTADNIDKIIKTYNDRKDVDKYAHIATLDEIKENDYNLNIPRYVDTFEPEPPVNMVELGDEMIKTDEEIKNTEAAIIADLKQLTSADPEIMAGVNKLITFLSH